MTRVATDYTDGVAAGTYPVQDRDLSDVLDGVKLRFFADFAKRGKWLGERKIATVELTGHVADYAGAVAEAKRLEGAWCHEGWALWSVRLVRETAK
jgi:hypothetical protein